jgi:hypothetical protein
MRDKEKFITIKTLQKFKNKNIFPKDLIEKMLCSVISIIKIKNVIIKMINNEENIDFYVLDDLLFESKYEMLTLFTNGTNREAYLCTNENIIIKKSILNNTHNYREFIFKTLIHNLHLNNMFMNIIGISCDGRYLICEKYHKITKKISDDEFNLYNFIYSNLEITGFMELFESINNKIVILDYGSLKYMDEYSKKIHKLITDIAIIENFLLTNIIIK